MPPIREWFTVSKKCFFSFIYLNNRSTCAIFDEILVLVTAGSRGQSLKLLFL